MSVDKCMWSDTDNQILFKTCVGSHMWKMERPDSDLDYFVAQIAPTRKILDGTANTLSEHIQSDFNIDMSAHEIGKIIDMLLKGNVNFIWGVLSPVVPYEYKNYHKNLRDIVLAGLSKNISKSIYGMARHNYERYIRDNMGEKDVSGELLIKKANTIVRTLNFGVEILQERPISFSGFKNQTMKEVLDWMKILLDAETYSSLPNKPPNEEKFRQYLYESRMENLAWC